MGLLRDFFYRNDGWVGSRFSLSGMTIAVDASRIYWRPQRDLNPRPADSKSDALSGLSYRGAI